MTIPMTDPTLEQAAFDELATHEHEIEQALPFASPEDARELYGELLEMDEAREDCSIDELETSPHEAGFGSAGIM